ncbi:MAG: hypothetical protein CFE24_07340 [Flavobacterium sp. BFFFF2]|nr:MAG: hypothetical protein CFE24_07340 [Flavobacterium sp. BFFFF2]
MLTGFAQNQSQPAATASNTAPAAPAKDWETTVYGSIRTDYMGDTRKMAQVREYNLDLYPLDESLDANGTDINKAGAYNFLSITTKFGVKVKGPDVWGAKVNGTLEGDFFGNTESTIGLFRLRHAFVNLDWKKTGVLLGQTWYPTFIPEVMPGVANFNTGILFNPFGWSTQARFKWHVNPHVTAIFTAYKEREFTTPTVIGTAPTNSDLSQNSASINSPIPSLNAQMQYKKGHWFAGAGFEFKSMQPLSKSNGLATSEKVNSQSVYGYFKYANDQFGIKAYGIYGGNTYNMVMLGGYAGTNHVGGVETYDPIKVHALWFELYSTKKAIAPGLFIGYTKNDGSTADAFNTLYGRGYSATGTRGVDHVFRTSGRVSFQQNKFSITPEVEYTSALWGDVIGNGAIGNNHLQLVGNVRFLILCMYSF